MLSLRYPVNMGEQVKSVICNPRGLLCRQCKGTFCMSPCCTDASCRTNRNLQCRSTHSVSEGALTLRSAAAKPQMQPPAKLLRHAINPTRDAGRKFLQTLNQSRPCVRKQSLIQSQSSPPARQNHESPVSGLEERKCDYSILNEVKTNCSTLIQHTKK